MAVRQITGLVWQNAGAAFFARVTGTLGTNITEASILSIAAKVMDVSVNPPVLVASINVPLTAISDTLVANDPRWTQDALGYNFLYSIAHTAFPVGNNPYLVQFVFTPVTGEPFPIEYRLDSVAVY
jgi:hypothetical protein